MSPQLSTWRRWMFQSHAHVRLCVVFASSFLWLSLYCVFLFDDGSWLLWVGLGVSSWSRDISRKFSFFLCLQRQIMTPNVQNVQNVQESFLRKHKRTSRFFLSLVMDLSVPSDIDCITSVSPTHSYRKTIHIQMKNVPAVDRHGNTLSAMKRKFPPEIPAAGMSEWDSLSLPLHFTSSFHTHKRENVFYMDNEITSLLWCRYFKTIGRENPQMKGKRKTRFKLLQNQNAKLAEKRQTLQTRRAVISLLHFRWARG